MMDREPSVHVVIPMSGIGNRFLHAGYTLPKPLIVVDDKPMMAHVVALFPRDVRFTFVCNQDHLDTTDMRYVLEKIAPSATVFGIAPHKKGPVHAVLQIAHLIQDDEEVIVNYCDFSKKWDYNAFLSETRARHAAGAMTVYRGFHPHMLGKTQYAFCREKDMWLLEIREKQPFTYNRWDEYASDGTYYFRRGRDLKRYSEQLIDRDIQVNGEYYMSMVYNLLLEANLGVSLHEIPHMLQWGTPEDLWEYQRWSRLFARLVTPEAGAILPNGLTVMPMAGEGERFRREGFLQTKPFVPVSGKPMVLQALETLPKTQDVRLVLRQALVAETAGDPLLASFLDNAIVLDGMTEGQALTVLSALRPEDGERPLLVGACDTGILFDTERWNDLVTDPSVDAVSFSLRGYAPALEKPEMYGWLAADDTGTVTKVSVKSLVSEIPEKDHVITGVFYFRSVRLFLEAIANLQLQNKRVNGEFYVDSLVSVLCDAGSVVRVLEVEASLCWGTPDEWRTFGYWQRYFDACPEHPYSLDLDAMVPNSAVVGLRQNRAYLAVPCPHRGIPNPVSEE